MNCVSKKWKMQVSVVAAEVRGLCHVVNKKTLKPHLEIAAVRPHSERRDHNHGPG